jgi:hypothetical protein
MFIERWALGEMARRLDMSVRETATGAIERGSARAAEIVLVLVPDIGL